MHVCNEENAICRIRKTFSVRIGNARKVSILYMLLEYMLRRHNITDGQQLKARWGRGFETVLPWGGCLDRYITGGTLKSVGSKSQALSYSKIVDDPYCLMRCPLSGTASSSRSSDGKREIERGKRLGVKDKSRPRRIEFAHALCTEPVQMCG